MTISVDDYEKLGKFYLGREYDLTTKKTREPLLLYDSKDLVTHGVVLGMTGSGKTGLCISILEEAAMDSIPAIVIDPKGDIANLLLTFPNFDSKDFRPWINEDDAQKKGKTAEQYAQDQAKLWEKGLADWGQTGERIQKFKEKVDINIYTPGSNAGIPVSILGSLNAPPFEVLDDSELLGDCIENTVSSLLTLIGIEADPIRSKEHILLSTIFNTVWQRQENVDLKKLIGYIQTPPFESVGVIDLESFFPEKGRIELAMQINNLLAAPGFSTWLTGAPLDMQRLYHTPEGKPRISVFSIAHLDDKERLFFVSLLLNQILGWMREQSGTTSLRALLYMDEIYGYLPPQANPPSKKPMLTMLKQARAFGLGILLATQNPVDLDYKALSNIGTWFLGRLQTERDKMRVLDGLEGAAAGQKSRFNRQKMEEILAGLGSRVFLLNNVHEEEPVLFHVRWVMSYLRGPLTRRQIKTLMDPKKEILATTSPSLLAGDTLTHSAKDNSRHSSTRDPLPPSIKQYFLPAILPIGKKELLYFPALLRAAEVTFSDNRKHIHATKKVELLDPIAEEAKSFDLTQSSPLPLGLSLLEKTPMEPAQFQPLPAFCKNSSNYTAQKKAFIDYLYHEEGLSLFKSTFLKEFSKPEESEADFRVRLQHRAREERDRLTEKLRASYEAKIKRLEERIERAILSLEKEKSESRSAKMQTVISIGTTIFSAILGRKSVSMGSISRGATAGKSASRAFKQSKDVELAEGKIEGLHKDLEQLQEELEEEIEKIHQRIDPMTEELQTIRIAPKKKDINVKLIALVWTPYYRKSEFEIAPAWQV